MIFQLLSQLPFWVKFTTMSGRKRYSFQTICLICLTCSNIPKGRSTMKEIVSFHVGQGGLQLGNAVWELFTAEHNIHVDGSIVPAQPGTAKHYPDLVIDNLSTFFTESSTRYFIPRSVMVDMEPTVADEIRHGNYRSLFHPANIITGYQCSGNNFARGLFCVDTDILTQMKIQVRKEVERCDAVQAFLIYRSLGGGTGTGTTVALCDCLLDYAKVARMEVPIYPSPSLATSTVEPYNAILGEHYCMEDMDIGLLIDNEAMYDICFKFLGIANPNYSHLNRLVAQVIACATAGLRFDNQLYNDIPTLQTNLIPYPRIHFPMCNFSPVVNSERGNHQPLRLHKLVRSVFDQSNQLVKCDTRQGRYIACALFLRGKVHAAHLYETLGRVKAQKQIRFVDWDPTGFKVGIVSRPPTVVSGSMLAETPNNCALITNHTSVGQAWSRLIHKFQMLYSKRSFIHWYVSEGLEESEFMESLDNMQSLVNDYKDVGVSTNDLTSNSEDGRGGTELETEEEECEEEGETVEDGETVEEGEHVEEGETMEDVELEEEGEEGEFAENIEAEFAEAAEECEFA